MNRDLGIAVSFPMLAFLSIAVISCRPQDTKSARFFNTYSNDSVRFEIFKRALANQSTAPNYVVVHIRDQQSGSSKEICTEAPFLQGALHQEFNLPCDSAGEASVDSIARSHKDRVFSFANPMALRNIGFFEYPSIDSVLTFARRLDLRYYTMTFSGNRRIGSVCFAADNRDGDQILFAHAMFQCGVLLTRDCFAGNYVNFGDMFHPDTTETQSGIFEPDSVHYKALK